MKQNPFTWHQPLLAGASLAMLLGAGSASAEDCPTPTLEICQKEGYLQSTCGTQYSKLCNELIDKSFQSAWESLKTERLSLLPEELGGEAAVTHVVPHDVSALSLEGGEGGYAGVVLKNQLLYRKNFDKLDESDKIQLEALKSWDSNKEEVRSCQEYVHEKYYDYSLFENRVGAFGPDYRAVFTAAYDKEGIAGRELKSRSGEVLAPIFPGKYLEKNLYFRFEVGPYPDGTDAFKFDPKLVEQVPAKGREFYKSSFGWHSEMSKTLANYLDDELDELYAKQAAFADLVSRRQRTWDFYQAQLKRTDPKEQDALRKQVAAELYNIDKSLSAGLVEAQKLGCLGLNGSNRCDWSPSRFKAQLDTEMLTRREQDYQSCLELTGNDFSDSSFIRNADKLEIGLKGDYSVSTLRVSEYLSAYLEWLRKNGIPRVPVTREIRKSWSRSDHQSIGGSYFGASYDYSAGLDYTATTTSATADQSCGGSANLYARLTANARVFGAGFEVIHGRAEANAQGQQFHYLALLRVLGADVYRRENTIPLRFSISAAPSVSKEFFRVGTYFVIVAIPVSVQGGVSGSVGLTAGLDGGFQSACAFNLHGNVKPWASLDAFAQAAVDVWVVSAGVRGRVTLLRVELPLDAEIAFYLDTATAKLMMRLAASLGLNLRTLDGRIVLFLDGFWGNIAEFELASFTGPQFNTTFFNESYVVPVASLN
ncbi:hypothetical protein [Vitiosangium sp. GDMCC 1.1324]|uniref:hypothetical protein n=1 Tax=Vitiosangium sp. (strain GDMCC 1.1324) TaxID=2138576 RepID=UPI000D35A7A6|nr:hypothetical protein [Vitiosangium sp. GDMCC 1.1324]PTL83943.1 hypothetical protein DAT35_10815 [Vitiosangium sp. GDMCC 1.1324]